MLKIIKGAHVTASEKLSQGYEITDFGITANTDADNIRKIIEDFLVMNNDLPLFLFIEVPANLKDEKVIGKEEDGAVLVEKSHKDVYYLDGVSSEELGHLLDPLYDILINDGLSAFGVGNPNGEEIGKYKYNAMILYAKNPDKYIQLFEKYNISRTDKLVTAWDSFTPETPGKCERYYDKSGRDIYDIIVKLKEVGLYKAEQRED